MKKITGLLFILFPLMLNAESLTVYFGTSGGNQSGSKGIYSTSFDTESGKLSPDVRLVGEISSPGFLARHPSLPVIYSTGNKVGTRTPVAASWAIGDDGSLNAINQEPTDCGGSAHLAVDPTGKLLVTAQYGNGTIAVFPIKKDGKLEAHSQIIQLEKATKATSRQNAPHPHNVTFSPCGHYVFVPDLGADCTYVFKVDLKGKKLIAHGSGKTKPGSGPRHMKFSVDGKLAYVLNELSLTVDSFAWDPESGKLTLIDTEKTLPEAVKERELMNTASEIRVHPNGKWVYTANRGNDSISVYKVNKGDGTLKWVDFTPARVAWPRNFNIDPTGKWIIVGGQNTSNTGVFSIDQTTGLLTYQQRSAVGIPAPICILF
ncbi:MAG: lactonase family protein [Puniceicoccaceae bacterium]